MVFLTPETWLWMSLQTRPGKRKFLGAEEIKRRKGPSTAELQLRKVRLYMHYANLRN